MKRNLSGTVSSSYSIGNQGPTIRQGTTAPDNGEGSNGDLYIRHGGSQGVFRKTGGTWVAVENDRPASVVADVFRGTTFNANSSVTFVSIVRNPYTADSIDVTIDDTDITIDNHPANYTEIVLANAVSGSSVIVKDATANAAQWQARVSGSVNIDGAAYVTITNARGFVELIYSGNAWRVVGR